MPALTNKRLLLVAVLVCSPTAAQAQTSRFFKPSTTKTRQTHIPTQRQALVANPKASASAHLRQVQFEDRIPAPVVPSPLNEATIPGLDAAPTMDLSSPSNMPPIAESESVLAPPPAAETYGGTYSDSYAESVDLSASPIADGASVGELILDSGYGQTYDIPLNDVIPQQSAETYSTSDWFRNGNWSSRQELVMLLRADLPLRHLATDPSSGSASPFNPNLTPSLSTKDTDFTFEAGTRLSIGHRLGRDPANRDHSLEFVFFGLFDYTGRAALTPVNPGSGGIVSLLASEEATFSGLTGGAGFVTVNFIPGLTNNLAVDLVHKSDFNSFELNYILGARPAKDRLVMQPDGRWVRHATPSKFRGLFAGLRYVRQHDLFQYRGTGIISAAGTDLDLGGNYLVKTENDLVGVQLGGEFVRKRTDWVFGLNGKAGGLVNFANRSNRLSQTTASTATGTREVITEITESNLQDETLTFLVEGGAYAAYFIRPNTSIRLGYNVMYMNGMATATNNLGILGGGTEFAKFELTGDTLYHGMNLGFEMSW